MNTTSYINKGFGIKEFIGEDNFFKLQSIMYDKHSKRGTFLFWEDDPALKLYYLRSGRIHLRKSTSEGRSLILSIAQQGDLIGEVDGNAETSYSFNAEVMEDAELGVIQKKDLEILLYRHGDFAIQFAKWLSLNNRIAQSKLRDLLLYGKQGALASTLIRLSETNGEHCEDGIHLRIKLTNSELADLTGTTREGINRMLSMLKFEKIIRIVNSQILIRDMDGLRKYCRCPASPACPTGTCRL